MYEQLNILEKKMLRAKACKWSINPLYFSKEMEGLRCNTMNCSNLISLALFSSEEY